MTQPYPAPKKESILSADEKDRLFWLVVRKALLLLVDGIELYKLDMPRTAELRKENRANAYQQRHATEDG